MYKRQACECERTGHYDESLGHWFVPYNNSKLNRSNFIRAAAIFNFTIGLSIKVTER